MKEKLGRGEELQGNEEEKDTRRRKRRKIGGKEEDGSMRRKEIGKEEEEEKHTIKHISLWEGGSIFAAVSIVPAYPKALVPYSRG